MSDFGDLWDGLALADERGMTSIRGTSFSSKLLLVGALSALAGCSSFDDLPSVAGGGVPNGGSFGATQGGVQDMTFARDLVRQGRVPPPEALLVEAMFSEHDLPLSGDPCATLLCPRAAMGVAPDGAGTSKAWMQVGLSSTIDPATFERPSISIVATVDVSGSMGWGYQGGDGVPADVTRNLLGRIADELGPQDRLSIVTYGSTVNVALPWVSGGDAAIDNAIAALGANGSTNMEAGLQTAYSVAAQASGTDETRVMLFTDVQPNVGATSSGEFEQLVQAGAEAGVGTTVFGAGLGMGAEVLEAMANVRGGNAFSLTEVEQVGGLMTDSWPWMVSPIAYDMSLTVRSDAPLGQTYGFPGDGSLEVATVFLSKRRGALLLSFDAEAPIESASADVTLSYTTPAGEALELPVTASYDGEPLDERGTYMPQTSVDKAVALALLVEGMQSAAEVYGQDPSGAAAMLAATLERFATDAAAIEDAALDEELAFWNQLLQLMEQGAPQGDLYGQNGG